MKRNFVKRLAEPKSIAMINAIFLCLAVVANSLLQVFCVPVLWVWITIVVCFANTIFYQVLPRNGWWLGLTSFINGITLCLFCYLIIFLEEVNVGGFIIGLFYFGVGVLAILPFAICWQMTWFNLLRPVNRMVKYYFLSGIALSLLLAVLFGLEYKSAIKDIGLFRQSNYTKLEKGYFTERIMGMHFIYHTRICIYDGWRPPKHDPALIIGMWLNNREDPLKTKPEIRYDEHRGYDDVGLEKRIKLYKAIFPGKPNQV